MKRRKRERLDDLQKHRIRKMVTEGGFSYRYIAAELYGVKQEKVTEQDVRRVVSFCVRDEIKVTDWRSGRTETAQQFVRRLLIGRAARRMA